MGRSRGGPTTKLHALVGGLGRLVAFTITPGQRGDAPVAAELVSLLPASATLAADRASNADITQHQSGRIKPDEQPPESSHLAQRSQNLTHCRSC